MMFTPTLQYQLTFEGLWPSAVAFLDSSRKLAAGNQKGEIYVWELPETPPEIPAEEKAHYSHRGKAGREVSFFCACAAAVAREAQRSCPATALKQGSKRSMIES